jgi:hypothetical protein
MMAAALTAALDLVAKGYAAFPCRADKKPACEHGFHDATTDAAELRTLWSRSHGVLVGVATGPASQIAVLDIDAKHDEARQWWQVHRPRLLPTRTHRTRSGGLHLIFGDHDDLKCSAGKIARGIDVRADGGYIIWWPAAGPPVLSDAPIAPWPHWLASAMPSPPPSVPRIVIPDRHALAALVRFVAGAHDGERNRVTFWAACRAGEMVRSGLISENTAAAVIAEAATRAGLPRTEAERTARSGVRHCSGGGHA